MYKRISTGVAHMAVLLLVGTLYRLARFIRLFTGYRHYEPEEGAVVLLTGTFNSEEWVMAFARPMTMSGVCREVVLVTTYPVKNQEGLTIVEPPTLLRQMLGDVAARLLAFLWQSLRYRPFLVGGFHISVNALVADLAAALAGARSMYVCVGGPIEVIGGGLRGESRFFSALRHEDPRVEEALLRTVRQFNVVATMGNTAARFFHNKGVDAANIHRVTGGVDASRFGSPPAEREVDIVFVGRLVPVKALDLLLRVVAELAHRGIRARTRIVGRGPLEGDLKALATRLGVNDLVTFAGFVPDIVDELRCAKCFVLTSESEGLSLAMIEAMLGGAVPVVADVGDLGDMVEHGVHGFLVRSRDPAEFADYLTQLLCNPTLLAQYRAAGYEKALECDLVRVADSWDALLDRLGHSRTEVS